MTPPKSQAIETKQVKLVAAQKSQKSGDFVFSRDIDDNTDTYGF
jgi:hypothetical protein